MRLVSLIFSVLASLRAAAVALERIWKRIWKRILRVFHKVNHAVGIRFSGAGAKFARRLGAARRRMASWTIFRPLQALGAAAVLSVGFCGRLGKTALDSLRQVNLDRYLGPLLWPFRPLWRALQALDIDRYLKPVVRPLWKIVRAVGEFGHAWVVTRDYKQLLWGLPAILMLLPFLFIGLRVALLGNGKIVARYRSAVADALEAKDFAAVQLYNRKLAQLGAPTDRTVDMTAAQLADEGQVTQAFERMSELAPADSLGFAPAHEWIVRQLLADRIEMPHPEQLELADQHLRQLESLTASDVRLDYLRAYWLVQSERLEDAAILFGAVADSIPEARVERMQIHLQLNDVDAARDDARRLASHYQVLERSGQSLSPTQIEHWSLAVSVLNDPEEMRPVLEKLLAVQPDNRPARDQLAQLLAGELYQSLGLSSSDPQELIQLLERVSQLTDDTQLWEPLVVQIFRHADRSANRPLMERLETTGAITSDVLTQAGTQAATQGEYPIARQMLQMALAKDDQNPVAWNNLAWLLSRSESQDLPAALEAVERSLQLQPDSIRFIETRGQILLKLQQWQPAIDDLELALNVMPDSDDIHRALALAYDALGNVEKAAAHRSQLGR